VFFPPHFPRYFFGVGGGGEIARARGKVCLERAVAESIRGCIAVDVIEDVKWGLQEQFECDEEGEVQLVRFGCIKREMLESVEVCMGQRVGAFNAAAVGRLNRLFEWSRCGGGGVGGGWGACVCLCASVCLRACLCRCMRVYPPFPLPPPPPPPAAAALTFKTYGALASACTPPWWHRSKRRLYR